MTKGIKKALAIGHISFLGVLMAIPALGAADDSALPDPRLESEVSLEEAIQQRRSIRSYSETTLTQAQIAQLCWAAQGITDPHRSLRASPSAGATYPLVLYVATAEALYRYSVEDHRLERQIERDLRPALRAASLDQMMVETAPAVFIIAADHRPTERRYGGRAERYVLMEVGHAGQNILLQAVALGLGAVPIGAFNDERVGRILALPDTQRPYYIIPVGVP